MYEVLIEAMKEKNITKKQIAEDLAMRYPTIVDKLNGKAPLKFDEALEIKNRYFPEKSIELLFRK